MKCHLKEKPPPATKTNNKNSWCMIFPHFKMSFCDFSWLVLRILQCTCQLNNDSKLHASLCRNADLSLHLAADTSPSIAHGGWQLLPVSKTSNSNLIAFWKYKDLFISKSETSRMLEITRTLLLMNKTPLISST